MIIKYFGKPNSKKIFGVKHVISRVFDPNREFTYRQLGLETISTIELVTNLLKLEFLKINYNYFSF
jgi:Trk K+ transport system NAD-binding subunit